MSSGARAILLIAVVGLGASAAFAGLATAGVVTSPAQRAPSRKALGLTAAERRAVTISSVTAADDGSLGLIVTATFKGDVERYLGQGKLRDGAVALILVPGSSGRKRSGVIDQDGGYAPVPVPLLKRRGSRVTVQSRTVYAFAPERVARIGISGQPVVIRHGNRVIFHLDAASVRGAAKVTVASVAKISTTSLHPPPSALWRELLSTKPKELISMTLDQSKLTCVQLGALKAELSSLASTSLGSQLTRQRRDRIELKAAIAEYAEIARLSGGPHNVTKSALKTELREAATKISGLGAQAAAIATLLHQVDVSIQSCAPPPPATTTTATTTTPPPTTTATTTTPTTPTPPPPTVHVVQTDSSLLQQMASQPDITMTSGQAPGGPVIDVNNEVTYQKFRGLGASMTDSSASVISQLSSSQEASLLQDLLTTAGIHLNFLRVPMAASDYTVSANPYSYDDMPSGQTDTTLTNFSISHDLTYIIPTLQQALKLNSGLEIQANPWSAPPWMKQNDAFDNLSSQGVLLSANYQYLANYFVKFIQAYESNGVPIDGITPQNEPGTPVHYPSETLAASDEATFINDWLAPALNKAGLNTKVYGNDLSWSSHAYANTVVANVPSSELAGIAWHCYFGSPTQMTTLHQSNPGLDQIVNECSPEIRSFGAPEFLISSLRNWATVVSVWNVALDSTGAPHGTYWGCHGCKGLVTVDDSSDSFTLTNEYYQFGQISSFVQPGAVRIDSTNFVTYSVNSSNIETISSGLDDVAFRNPDGSEVLLTYNNSSAPISFAVQSGGNYFTYSIPAGAMTTFVWPGAQ